MRFQTKPQDTLLTVLEVAGTMKGHKILKCRCACGKEVLLREYQYRTGKTKSCGCLQASGVRGRMVTHGMTGTKIYRVWAGMMSRCYTKTTTRYKNYGGRGITVCERWHKFENFYADMGERPSDLHSINRLDNDKGYAPENCAWATTKEQSGNKSSTVVVTNQMGTKVCLKAHCDALGKNYSTVRGRMLAGMTVEQATTAEIPPRPTMLLHNETVFISEYCKKHKLNYEIVKSRLNNGWSAEDAVEKPAKPRQYVLEGTNKMLLTDYCKTHNINYSSVIQRLHRGETMEHAIANSSHRKFIYVMDGDKKVTLREYCAAHGVNYSGVFRRIKECGMTPEEALTIPSKRPANYGKSDSRDDVKKREERAQRKAAKP